MPHFIDQISLPPQSDQTNRILIQLSHLITAFLTTSLDLLGRSITEIYGKVKILQGIMICCTEFFFRLYSGERRISLIAAKMGEQVSDFDFWDQNLFRSVPRNRSLIQIWHLSILSFWSSFIFGLFLKHYWMIQANLHIFLLFQQGPGFTIHFPYLPQKDFLTN